MRRSDRSSTGQSVERETLRPVKLVVNGREHVFVLGHDISAADSLAYVLKEKLGHTGLKVACDEGACGACTVLMDGKAVLSCMTLAIEAEGHEVTTIEGLAEDDPILVAFADQCEPGYGTAMQCGYCTPGFVMATKAFLADNPNPSVDEIKEALSGNICRCGCYSAIIQAVLSAAEKIRNKEGR